MILKEALERYRSQAGPKFAARVERYFRWLGTAEGSNSDAAFSRFLADLQREGMAPATIDLYSRTIRSFFRSVGMVPPRARGFRFDPKDSRRPALASDLIRRMVEAAKSGDVTPRVAAYLALASVYGLRAGEVSAIRMEDMDRDGQRIYIRAEKGSVSRWCWLPPEVAAWLPEEWSPASPNAVEKAFTSLWESVLESPKPERTGWHAIRRALARDLRAAGVPDWAIVRFLRWKSSGSGAMKELDLYSHPNLEVAEEGERAVRDEDQGKRDYDCAVWDAHPYMPLWSR